LRRMATQLDTKGPNNSNALLTAAPPYSLSTFRSAKPSLRVLEDCPDELFELRATLLQEHVWRRREGLDRRQGATLVATAPPSP
jgi:hypothetical protein